MHEGVGGSTVRVQDLERLRMEDADAATGKQGTGSKERPSSPDRVVSRALNRVRRRWLDAGSAAVALQVLVYFMVSSVW